MLDLNLVLAIAHHLAVFTLVAIFAAEFALLRPGIEGKRLVQLGKIDMAYGTMAWLVIVVGILRVLLGGAGWEYYAGNWAFWLKMAAFFGVGLFSLPPTVALFRWRKAGTTPSATDVNTLRRYLWLQAALYLLIPTFAATMARGYGTM
jgi:putative membrane protein